MNKVFALFMLVAPIAANAGIWDSITGVFSSDEKPEPQPQMIQKRPLSENFFDMSDTAKPVVLCRDRGCTEISDRMSKSALFNALASIFYANDKTKAYMCEADTQTRACKSSGLKFPLNVGGTAGVIQIPSFTVTDVVFAKNLKRINFMISYDIYVNGVKSFCSTAQNLLEVSDKKQVLIRDNQYRCQLTSDIPSTAGNIYNVDYVDLDYGIIGAYYSTTISGASFGGADGYVLVKFQNSPQKDGMFGSTKNTACSGSTCDEDYRIPAGQYDVLPYKEEKK